MRDIGIQNLVREITENKSDLLFVSSVNYEKRSLEWLRVAKKIIAGNKTQRQLQLYRLALENSEQLITILNEKTQSHEIDYKEQVDALYGRINTDSISIKLSSSTKRLLLSDLPDIDEMVFDLSKNSNLVHPFNIIFDITALPRRVILLMMGTFVRLVQEKKATSLYVLYTWPLRYPLAGRSTNTGSLRVENSKVPLIDFLDAPSEIHAIMAAGRDGSIGRLFLESIPARSRIDTFFHVKKDDYLYAHDSMLNNANVFSYIDKNPSTTVNYYLSVSRGYEAVMNKVKGVLHEWNLTRTSGVNRALLIAPFGPKPMMITAFIGTHYSELFYRKNNLNYKAGIVHVTSLQQNDLYSIGVKDTSCYKIKISDLVGN